MIHTTKLQNGIRGIVVPMKGVKAATALVLVRTGSKYETKRTNGVAHFVEHMIFKGSKKYPSVRKLTETLDRLGAEYNAFTSKEMTGYWVKAAGEKRGKVLEIVASMLRDPLFPRGELERERGVILQELNLYFDTPARFIHDLWEKLLWGDQPAGWHVGGTPQSVGQITYKDLSAFFKTHYVGHATVVCLAGAAQQADLNPMRKLFSKIGAGEQHQHSKIQEEQTHPQVLVYYKKTDQTHIDLGFRAVSLTHPMRYALAVLATVLGGTMSSRLFLELRDKLGLAYSVKTETFFDTESGYLVTSAGVKHEYLEKAIRAVLAASHHAKKYPPAREELMKAKEAMLGRFVLDLEQTDEVASYVATNALLLNKYESAEEEMRRLKQVTARQIQEAARLFFTPERLNFALIGPYRDKKPFYKLLNNF